MNGQPPRKHFVEHVMGKGQGSRGKGQFIRLTALRFSSLKTLVKDREHLFSWQRNLLSLGTGAFGLDQNVWIIKVPMPYTQIAVPLTDHILLFKLFILMEKALSRKVETNATLWNTSILDASSHHQQCNVVHMMGSLSLLPLMHLHIKLWAFCSHFFQTIFKNTEHRFPLFKDP